MQLLGRDDKVYDALMSMVLSAATICATGVSSSIFCPAPPTAKMVDASLCTGHKTLDQSLGCVCGSIATGLQDPTTNGFSGTTSTWNAMLPGEPPSCCGDLTGFHLQTALHGSRAGRLNSASTLHGYRIRTAPAHMQHDCKFMHHSVESLGWTFQLLIALK